MTLISSFTSKFSPSEQKLIGLAALLCLLLGGWQFIIKPISSAKSQSAAQYNAAVRDYDIVQRALPSLGAGSAQNSNKPAVNRAAIIETARSVNLAISRVQPGQGDAVQVWFDETRSAQVYNFLQLLEGQYGVEISNAQLSRRQNGLISAQFTFTPTGTAAP